MNSITFAELTMRLALGSLKTQSIVSETNNSTIKADKRAMIKQYTNQGLVALFSRFILLEKEIIITAVPEITHYYIRKEFAVSNVTDVVPLKYLDDSLRDNYEDDLLRIMTVYSEVGVEMPLNDRDQNLSLFTPEYDCLQITDVHTTAVTNRYAVTYQATHPEILGTDPCQEIHVPFFLIPALQTYITALYFTDMMGPDHIARGAALMEQYNVICDELESKDLVKVSESSTTTKLDDRGFV